MEIVACSHLKTPLEILGKIQIWVGNARVTVGSNFIGGWGYNISAHLTSYVENIEVEMLVLFKIVCCACERRFQYFSFLKLKLQLYYIHS